MATTDRDTGVINISGQIGLNTSSLRSFIDNRKKIKPSDLDLIRQTYELFRAHTHDYFDQQFLAFPNTAPQPTASRTATSSGVYNASVDASAIQGGPGFYDTFSNEIFELINNFNSYVHQHQHEFDDQAF